MPGGVEGVSDILHRSWFRKKTVEIRTNGLELVSWMQASPVLSSSVLNRVMWEKTRWLDEKGSEMPQIQ
jgi:hypothetical protein